MKSIRLSNGDALKPRKQVQVEGPGGEKFWIDDPSLYPHDSDTTRYVQKVLEKAKADGVDIYGDPREWLEYLPEETQGYIQKILFDDLEEGE